MHKTVYYVFLENNEGQAYGVTGPYDIIGAVSVMKAYKHTPFWGANPRIVLRVW